MTLFPVTSHQTGRAGFPPPAFCRPSGLPFNLTEYTAAQRTLRAHPRNPHPPTLALTGSSLVSFLTKVADFPCCAPTQTFSLRVAELPIAFVEEFTVLPHSYRKDTVICYRGRANQ